MDKKIDFTPVYRGQLGMSASQWQQMKKAKAYSDSVRRAKIRKRNTILDIVSALFLGIGFYSLIFIATGADCNSTLFTFTGMAISATLMMIGGVIESFRSKDRKD